MTTLAEINGKLIATKLAFDPGIYLDVDQVAERYQVTPKQWIDWCRCGLVPEPVRVAGEIRWPVAELVRWEWEQSAGQEAWDCYAASIEPVDVTRLDRWGNVTEPTT